MVLMPFGIIPFYVEGCRRDTKRRKPLDTAGTSAAARKKIRRFVTKSRNKGEKRCIIRVQKHSEKEKIKWQSSILIKIILKK